jgi:hypothetical protein
MIAVSCTPAFAPAALLRESGDLEAVLRRLPMPNRAGAFVEPGDADMQAWRRALAALLTHRRPSELALAADLAAAAGYDLVEFADGGRDRTYFLLREIAPARGLGTYVYHPGACRRLAVQAPHAGGDTDTLSQSAAFFTRLAATALLVPGTHRCASRFDDPPRYSPCDGWQTICEPAGSPPRPYPTSDVAHYGRNYFEPAHETVATVLPRLVSLSVHGMTPTSYDAIIGNGTCADQTPSLATDLAAAYGRLFAAFCVADAASCGLRAGSCQQMGGPTSRCFETNFQGRFLAGSANPCSCARGGDTCAATSACARVAAFPERFLHLEQTCRLRRGITTCPRPPLPAGVDPYQVGLDALSAVFGCVPQGYLSERDTGTTSERGDGMGTALATGDFDGDGLDDLAIGIAHEDDRATDDGNVIVLYGARDARGTRTERLAQEAGAAEAGDRFGAALAAGDFDGDGVDDLAVGVAGEDDRAADDGNVVVFRGGPGGLLVATPERLRQQGAAAAEAGDRFGAALAAGDFNGDGVDDLAVGVPGEDDRAADDGNVIVLYGRASGLGAAASVRLEQQTTGAGATGEAGDGFGTTLAAGDFDGDGIRDLAVGVPAEDARAVDDGLAIVFYGSAAGLLPARCERLGQQTPGVGALGESGDGFAAVLAAADFDADGVDDLAVGIPGEDERAVDDGSVIVFSGSPLGLVPVAVQRLAPAAAPAGARFGAALAAGDIDGDGRTDLAVGLPGDDAAAADEGTVVVFPGSGTGLVTSASFPLSQRAAGGLAEAGDGFATSLAFGDFDADGAADLAIGAPGEDVAGAADAGAVYVVNGR